MVNRLLYLLILSLALVSVTDSSARGRSSGGGRSTSSSSSTGTVPVRGYYRQNGTFVQPYVRRAPGTATDSSTSSTNVGTVYDPQSALGPQQIQPNERAVKEEPLPKGFSTAAERAVAAKKEARKNRANATPEVRVAGIDAKGNPIWSVTVARDSHGKIQRSEAAKRAFMQMTGYPNGRPGYVVDHIIPLKRGGADNPANMQWQTTAEAKAKDKWE